MGPSDGKKANIPDVELVNGPMMVDDQNQVKSLNEKNKNDLGPVCFLRIGNWI